jgi:hypothetical protein
LLDDNAESGIYHGRYSNFILTWKCCETCLMFDKKITIYQWMKATAEDILKLNGQIYLLFGRCGDKELFTI